jgi:tetratricopeptide (TPR) repeat protein
MWRIPGVTALGLLCLAVAAALIARSGSVPGVESGRLAGRSRPSPLSAAGVQRSASRRALVWRSRAGRTAAGVVLLGSVALVLSLYLSDVYVRRARDEAGYAPAAQLADARTAADLDPWSVDPHYLEASALESMGNRLAARLQLEDTRRLEPTSLVPFGLIGDFDARGGKFAQARVYYRRALELDPLDVGLQQLARTGGKPSTPVAPGSPES